MGSSIGSDAFALLALLVISLLVLLLLRHFLPLRTTPAYLLVPVFLALSLPVSIILLVPIDLASNSGTDDEVSRGIWLPDRLVLVVWRIAYWLTFCLTWIILPLLGEYVDSGFRTPKDRILYSLRSNGRYQLIVLGCGSLGLVYVFWENGFDAVSVKSLVMALAYCWGLILAIYLMGHGLVAIPRRLYRNANVGERLRRIQTGAPKLHEQMTDSITELEELEAQVTQLRRQKNGISMAHQEWIEDIADMSAVPQSRAGMMYTSRTSGASIPAVVTDRYLAELTRKLNRARHKRVRFIDAWDRLTQSAAEAEAILNASASKQLDFGRSLPHANFTKRWQILTPYTRYLLHRQGIPTIRLGLAVVFALASACIVWSELIKIPAPQLSIISLTVIHHRNDEKGEIGFAGQLISSLWIFYMCAAALASFDDVKIWGNRAIVRRNTYGESACWYAGQIAKLTVPLTYNFLTFLPRDVREKTTFYQFLGRLINLTNIGSVFDHFFPLFILVPVCATLFNLYGKAKRILGFGIIEDDNGEAPLDSSTRTWREGRDLIARELNDPAGVGLSLHPGRASSSFPSENSSQSGNGPGNHISSTRPNPSIRAPTLYVPPAQDPPGEDVSQRQAQRLSAATQAAEEEDENIFQGFAHRVRNTLDNVERPDWLPEIGKRPKWMRGSDNSNESSGRAEFGRGMGRWFGGRPSDGRLRL